MPGRKDCPLCGAEYCYSTAGLMEDQDRDKAKSEEIRRKDKEIAGEHIADGKALRDAVITEGFSSDADIKAWMGRGMKLTDKVYKP